MSALRAFAKRSLFRLSPRLATSILSARARAHSHRVVATWGGPRVARKLVERFGNRVLAGPFEGLILTPRTFAEQIGPYLLGVYESELDSAWDVILTGRYTHIADIGAKFGYYAVGLARKYPKALVTAFDTDWWARAALREMARANETVNVRVRSHCTYPRLLEAAQGAAFVLSDCEGYEDALFSPDAISSLSAATILVETHEEVAPGVTERLRAAFASTHVVREYIASHERRTSAYALDFLTPDEQQLALHEVRNPQRWLVCLPREGVNSALRFIHASGPASDR